MKQSSAGWLLMALLALSLANGFVAAVPPEWAGLAGWGAGMLLAQRLQGALRIQVVAMLTVGIAGLVWGALQGSGARLGEAVSANQRLLAMLVGVSFLRLIALPETGRRERLPEGPHALWRTLLGVHFFGAVINLSAVMILGERQAVREPSNRDSRSHGFASAAACAEVVGAAPPPRSGFGLFAAGRRSHRCHGSMRRGDGSASTPFAANHTEECRLTRLQAIVLSRGFSAAAHWSPFFAAMGVALTNAPGSALPTLAAVGLPVALLALAVTGVTLSRDGEAAAFRGYPMHFEALRLPAALAVSVLVLHELWPQVRILTWIALLSPSLAGIGLIVRAHRAALPQLARHVQTGLPQMAGELLLFLAAGVLAAGIASASDGLGLSALITRFGPTEAAGLLAAMILLAVAGVHPVISISVAGGILMPVVADPNLLALVFLMAWSLGVCASPLSGMHLAMQGRFGIPGARFVAWNGRYVVLMWLVDGLALHVYTWLAGG